jgi:hypothetical protein
MKTLLTILITIGSFLSWIPLLGWINWINIPTIIVTLLVLNNNQKLKIYLGMLLIINFFRFCAGGFVL